MERSTINFRVITDKDEAFLKQVYASTREDEFRHSLWSEAEKRDFFDTQYKFQKQSYQMNYLSAVHRIIQLGDIDIGRLIVNRSDFDLRIIDLSVLPKYRGHGIGSDILRSLIHEAHGGKVPARLMVEKNSPALTLYVRLGFVKTGETASRYEMECPVNLRAAEI